MALEKGKFDPALLVGLQNYDPYSDQDYLNNEDVKEEDRLIRLSREVAAEIILLQQLVIVFEADKRPVTPESNNHPQNIASLTKQIRHLQAKKTEYDDQINALQSKIRSYLTKIQSQKRQVAIEKPSTAKILEGIRKSRTEKVLSEPSQLPLWPEPMRGVPNAILRSCLFGANKRGKRRFLQREPMASVDSVDIIYTGPQLDQSDLDVWEGALHIGRLKPLGDRIEFTAKGFLKLIDRGGDGGKSIGKSDREWLKNVLARLKATDIEIKQGTFEYGGSLIDEYFRDEATDRYVLILNPRMRVMFDRDSWTQIDWSIRQKLRGHPLAQWLHGFYSTHAQPYPYKIETIHKLCGSEAGSEAKTEAERNKSLLGWRDDSLVPALEALAKACEDVGKSFTWAIGENDLLTVSRDPSKTQQKHIRAKAKIAIEKK